MTDTQNPAPQSNSEPAKPTLWVSPTDLRAWQQATAGDIWAWPENLEGQCVPLYRDPPEKLANVYLVVPDGYALVPIKPTGDMIDAGISEAHPSWERVDLHAAWEKMVEVAQDEYPAPQSNSVGILDYVFQDDLHNRLTPRVVDIAYSAFMLGACGKNKDDGGRCDWFNDTKPMVMEKISEIRAALAAQASEGGQP